MRTPLHLSLLRPSGRLATALLLLAAFASVACANTKVAEDPVWGKQPCAHCKMIVGEPRHAGQLTTKTGDRLFFDDPGCLVLAQHKRAKEVDMLWVRDDAGKWIDARAARYRTGAKTPMNFGYIADTAGTLRFADLEKAMIKGRGE